MIQYYKRFAETSLYLQAKNNLVPFLRSSTVHGLNQVVAVGRHLCESSIWALLVILSIYGTIYLSKSTWTRYQSSPTVLSIERDMLAWNTTFPSVTICLDKKIDPTKLSNYIKQTNTSDIEKKRLETFIKTLANSSFENFDIVPEYEGIVPKQYLDLLLDLKYEFKPTVTVGDSGIVLPVVPTLTEMGLCYAVNSEVAVYNSPEYRKIDRWDLVKSKNSSLVVHPFDREFFAQLMNISVSFNVYIHSPLDVPDVSTKFQRSAVNSYMKIFVTAMSVYTTPEAGRLRVSQRRCRYPEENSLRHNSVYTYTLCRMECRIMLCQKYCHCIPHFYRRIGDEKICDVKGLQCLGNYSDLLVHLKDRSGRKIDCKCFPTCDDVNYVIQSSSKAWLQNDNNLQWGINTYPKMRYRRDVIFGFTDVLVSVGGMAGLFLGCSVLSFIEILFFIAIRLFCLIRNICAH